MSAETDELVQATDKIRNALLAYGAPDISGAKLHDLMIRTVPSLNIREAVGIPSGPGALSAFVAKYLSQTVTLSGNFGGDLKYSITGHPRSSESLPNPSLWRTFVSPGSTDSVIVDAVSGQLSVRPRGSMVAQHEYAVETCSVDELRTIMETFVSQFDSEEQTSFNAALPAEPSYPQWLKCLQGLDSRKLEQWSQFRKDGILELFAHRIDGILESPKLKAACIASMSASCGANSQSVPRPNVKPQVNANIRSVGQPQTRLKAFGGTVSQSKVSLTRELAQNVVMSMSIEQLRELRVPLGAIIDAISGEP